MAGTTLRDFRSLKVREKAYQLTLDVYKVTRGFPRDELYGLTSQTRRAAASVAANIAEGCGRMGGAELGRFIQIAMGRRASLSFTYFWRATWNYSTPGSLTHCQSQVVEVKRMLTAFWQKLKADR
jgi:four helix bundle protein